MSLISPNKIETRLTVTESSYKDHEIHPWFSHNYNRLVFIYLGFDEINKNAISWKVRVHLYVVYIFRGF